MGVTIDEVADEVATKMKDDPEYAEGVVKALSEDDDLAEKMLDDLGLASKVAEDLLSGDGNLVDKVTGELEAKNFRVESKEAQREYTEKDVKRDFAIAAHTAERRKNGQRADAEDVAKKFDKGESAFVTKTTEETNFTNAGVAIPTPLADEVVEILDSQPVFIDAGARVMEMPQGKIDITRQNQRVSANWQGESATVSKSDPGFEMLQLTSHKLTVGHDVSNDFLRREDRLIGQDFMFSEMMQAAENKLDNTLLEGGGGNNQPEGLITQTDGSQVATSSGNTISDITDDLRTTQRDLAGADVPQNNRRYFMRPEVRIDFAYDINSNEDNFPFREEIVEEGSILGAPIETTTNINLDGSSDTNIYYAEMSEMIVGRGTSFELTASEHEKFSDDLTVLKLVSHWDFQMAHDKSASIIEDYTLQS